MKKLGGVLVAILLLAATAALSIKPARAEPGLPVSPCITASNNSSGSTSESCGVAWAPKRLSALSSTAVSVKASPGQLGMLECYNPNATVAYVQVFDALAANVTVGTTSPVLSFPVAATSVLALPWSNPGVGFYTGISVAATTTATGSTAPGTALDCNAAAE